jgi:hypothetical protein
MRKIIDMQMKIGDKKIAGISFDRHSKDKIPELIQGSSP